MTNDSIDWKKRRELRLSKEGLAYAGLKSESIILDGICSSLKRM